MILDFIFIILGLFISHFLKDINFLVLQFDFLKTGSTYPDFVIIYIIYFALQRDRDISSAIWLGFFAGILEDSTIIRFSKNYTEFQHLVGLHSLVYTLLAFILGSIKKQVDINNNTTISFIVFISTLMSRILIWFIMGILEEFYQSYSFLAPTLYTTIISPIWFKLLGFIFEKKEYKL